MQLIVFVFIFTSADEQLVVIQVQDHLDNTTTQDNILSFVEGICNDLGSFSGTCDAFVELYGPELLNYLIGQLDPDQICIDVGLCEPPALEL